MLFISSNFYFQLIVIFYYNEFRPVDKIYLLYSIDSFMKIHRKKKMKVKKKEINQRMNESFFAIHCWGVFLFIFFLRCSLSTCHYHLFISMKNNELDKSEFTALESLHLFQGFFFSFLFLNDTIQKFSSIYFYSFIVLLFILYFSDWLGLRYLYVSILHGLLEWWFVKCTLDYVHHGLWETL